MKLASIFAIAVLTNEIAAVNVRHLPDVRPELVADSDIAAHEAAREESAKVKKNPQQALLTSISADLDQINKDNSFGISFSQHARNEHAKELCTKITGEITDYATALITQVDTHPDETLTEQNAHNISAIVFYSVQLLEQRDALAMAGANDLDLAVNRLKSLQKLYLFEQKGGENYLG
tara:strand:+ start:88 stop:621 length:534 start_codon:yes stop_codon:yes gene_type:complete